MRGRALTPKKFQVRWLKMFSYEVRVSELHMWLAHRVVATLSPSQQSTKQEDRFEESPHDANLKSSLCIHVKVVVRSKSEWTNMKWRHSVLRY